MAVYLPGCSRSAFLCAFLAADPDDADVLHFRPCMDCAAGDRRAGIASLCSAHRRTALSALVVAPAAAMAADNSGNYDDDPGGYQAPPGIPGFQAGPSFGPGYQKDGTRSVVASTTEVKAGGEFAKLFASSKASYEANSGLKMTPDEEKKLVEKLRKRYPGVARLAC